MSQGKIACKNEVWITMLSPISLFFVFILLIYATVNDGLEQAEGRERHDRWWDSVKDSALS